MQKKIIALAVAAAISAPAFADNANFTFYGTADVSYDIINTGNGTTTANGATAVTGVTKRVVSSNVSKFGFKGAEDLGDGLSAIWQIEQQIDLDAAAANTFASRNTFAGLKSHALGTVLMGKHDTPYKISTRKLDMFADNIGDNRALLGAISGKTANTSFDGRQSNVLAYISPSWSGFSIAAATVNLTEANTSSGPTTAQAQQTNKASSLAAMFDTGMIYAAIGYETHTLNTLNTATLAAHESAAKAGFGLNMDMFSLGVVYEKTSDNMGTGLNVGGNRYGHNALYVGGKVNFNNQAIKFAYGKAGTIGTETVTSVSTGATQMTVGYDYGMSKTTKLYALYSKIKNGNGINYSFSQSTANGSSVSGFGTSPSVISLGLKTSF